MRRWHLAINGSSVYSRRPASDPGAKKSASPMQPTHVRTMVLSQRPADGIVSRTD